MTKKTRYKAKTRYYKKNTIRNKKRALENLSPDEYYDTALVACRVPKIVKLVLELKAKRKGQLASEVFRDALYGVIDWYNADFRRQIEGKEKEKKTEASV